VFPFLRYPLYPLGPPFCYPFYVPPYGDQNEVLIRLERTLYPPLGGLALRGNTFGNPETLLPPFGLCKRSKSVLGFERLQRPKGGKKYLSKLSTPPTGEQISKNFSE
jgi:hypothetical protein